MPGVAVLNHYYTGKCREDFLEYFNTNADGEDKSRDDAISKYHCVPSWSLVFAKANFYGIWHSLRDLSTVVSLEGRMYPVEVCYLKEATSDYVEAAIQTIFDIHMKVRTTDNIGSQSC